MDKDKELIEKIQSGDSSAFAELYDRYFEKIYKFIYYKTTHKENAEHTIWLRGQDSNLRYPR